MTYPPLLSQSSSLPSISITPQQANRKVSHRTRGRQTQRRGTSKDSIAPRTSLHFLASQSCDAVSNHDHLASSPRSAARPHPHSPTPSLRASHATSQIPQKSLCPPGIGLHLVLSPIPTVPIWARAIEAALQVDKHETLSHLRDFRCLDCRNRRCDLVQNGAFPGR